MLIFLSLNSCSQKIPSKEDKPGNKGSSIFSSTKGNTKKYKLINKNWVYKKRKRRREKKRKGNMYKHLIIICNIKKWRIKH